MTDRKTAVVVLEQAEVICIIVEQLIGKMRPEGMDARDALDALDLDNETRDDLKVAADRIMAYFTQQLNAGGAEAKLERHILPEVLS